ncbi:MAG: 16S rRNA (guanine(966)-N(2))-methyltransferase RsmD [Halanaerobiales bacterium]
MEEEFKWGGLNTLLLNPHPETELLIVYLFLDIIYIEFILIKKLFFRGSCSMRIIAGESKGRKLKSIKGTSTRPTLDRVKESLFNIITPYILVDRGLDLFAGFGGLGLEALSRGVRTLVFVEKDFRNSKVIKENISSCGFEDRAKLQTEDVMRFLENTSDKFDIIFMDPPYKENLVEKSLALIDKNDLLNQYGVIVAEHESNHEIDMSEFSKSFTQLRHKVYGDSAITVLSKGGQ